MRRSACAWLVKAIFMITPHKVKTTAVSRKKTAAKEPVMNRPGFGVDQLAFQYRCLLLSNLPRDIPNCVHRSILSIDSHDRLGLGQPLCTARHDGVIHFVQPLLHLGYKIGYTVLLFSIVPGETSDMLDMAVDGIERIAVGRKIVIGSGNDIGALIGFSSREGAHHALQFEQDILALRDPVVGRPQMYQTKKAGRDDGLDRNKGNNKSDKQAFACQNSSEQHTTSSIT